MEGLCFLTVYAPGNKHRSGNVILANAYTRLFFFLSQLESDLSLDSGFE